MALLSSDQFIRGMSMIEVEYQKKMDERILMVSQFVGHLQSISDTSIFVAVSIPAWSSEILKLQKCADEVLSELTG